MDLVKTTVLLGFTLAAYNFDRIRSFKAKHRLNDNAQVVERAKAAKERGMFMEVADQEQRWARQRGSTG